MPNSPPLTAHHWPVSKESSCILPDQHELENCLVKVKQRDDENLYLCLNIFLVRTDLNCPVHHCTKSFWRQINKIHVLANFADVNKPVCYQKQILKHILEGLVQQCGI